MCACSAAQRLWEHSREGARTERCLQCCRNQIGHGKGSLRQGQMYSVSAPGAGVPTCEPRCPCASRALGKVRTCPDHASGRGIGASRGISTSLCTWATSPRSPPHRNAGFPWRSQIRAVHPTDTPNSRFRDHAPVRQGRVGTTPLLRSSDTQRGNPDIRAAFAAGFCSSSTANIALWSFWEAGNARLGSLLGLLRGAGSPLGGIGRSEVGRGERGSASPLGARLIFSALVRSSQRNLLYQQAV